MPEVRSFRGIRYNQNLVDISKVVAPPYDVISPERKRYYKSISEYNIARLLLEDELPGDNEKTNKYTRTGQYFSQWLEQRVLIQDKVPGFYVYAQEYMHENELKERLGFIGLMRISDEDGEVMPHENIFEETKTDRFVLLKEVKANLSPIFSVFDDPKKIVENILIDFVSHRKPVITVYKDGVKNRVFSLIDSVFIKKITECLRETHLFIADGHHRYESAKHYRDFKRSNMDNFTGDENFNFIMTYFVGDTDKGLVILPSHRIVNGVDLEKVFHRINGDFIIEEVGNYSEMKKKMREAMNNSSKLIGLYDGKKFRTLKLKSDKQLDENIPEPLKELDVTTLHSFIIPQNSEVRFTRDSDEVISAVRTNSSSLGFFLNPVEIECVKKVALSGERMPHKSTYFYPKLLSGLVINKI